MALLDVLTRTPELDIDLFGEASLRSPYADYRRLREAGPVVRLRRPDVLAVGRFADVQAALRAPDVLVSGGGVGFSEPFNATRGMNVLQSDGERHARMRATAMKPLSPPRLREARPDLKALVAARIVALAGGGTFDAMAQLASFLPVEVASHLVGLPSFGRERMLDRAAATFNLIGPDQDPRDLAALTESRSFMAGLSEETVRDGSWAGDPFAAVRTERLSPVEALAALSAYIVPSLDTTILAKGHLLHDLAANPGAWARIKADRSLIPGAVLESLRRNSVLRWFSRVALEDYRFEDGSVAPRGARLMLLYGCANRDERRYPDPDRFDVTRDPRDHLAWGTGTHMCAGMHSARLELEVLVEALADLDAALWAGEPVMGVNRGLFGYAALPYRIDTAQA